MHADGRAQFSCVVVQHARRVFRSGNAHTRQGDAACVAGVKGTTCCESATPVFPTPHSQDPSDRQSRESGSGEECPFGADDIPQSAGDDAVGEQRQAR
jgi:hypothetical protein